MGRSSQCCSNLCRMMCIVVNDGRSMEFAFVLETTVCSVEHSQTFGSSLEIKAKFHGGCQGSQCIGYVVDTRYTQIIAADLFAPEENGEGGQALASAADAENAPVADGITGKLAEKQEADSIYKNVIVIGRQYGCGGHDIGKKLAEKFGYEFYDQEIIQMIAGTTGMTSEFIRQKEESMTNSLLYDFVNQMYLYGKEEEEAPKDKIFEVESKVIRELAAKGKCVIIGRCSDYVLRENEKTLKLFFTAPLEVRAKRIMERLNISKKEAEQVIRKEDRRRADNYRYYTGRVWGSAANVDLTFNTAMDERYIEECISKAMELEI